MIILGIGSNLKSKFGDRFDNINLAITYLDSYGIKIFKKSSYYETFSYPNKKDPKFINVVVSVQSHLSPEDLASVLLFIETKLERKRNKKNEPRTCDIDIIDYNNEVLNFTYKKFDFIVPHKELVKRNFVLIPLQEIISDWMHPKTKESINDLIKKLSDEDRKSILKIKKT